jgi:hypothetical protein
VSAVRTVVPADVAEVSPLASELAHAYGRLVRFYREQLELSGPEADARARGADDTPDKAAADLARIRERPPDQVSWFDLTRVVERDPATASDLYQEIRAAAREEWVSGHRTARALDWDGTPWQRARFLAIRDCFRADYQPRPGIESALVDLASEAFGDYLEWSEAVHRQASTEADIERNDLERYGKWKPQRLFSAEAMAESARMAEAAHARFLRTIAALEARWAVPVHAGNLTIQQQAIIIAPCPDRQP